MTVEPTIVTGLPRDHRINRDELFAPFLSVLPFANLDDAISDANRSAYGLTAGIYTGDKAELDRFLTTIEAGVLYANRASGATTGAWIDETAAQNPAPLLVTAAGELLAGKVLDESLAAAAGARFSSRPRAHESLPCS